MTSIEPSAFADCNVMTTFLVRPGGADSAVDAADNSNSNVWPRLFAPFIALAWDDEAQDEVEGECDQLLPDETRMGARPHCRSTYRSVRRLQTVCRRATSTPSSTRRQNVGRRSAVAVVAPTNLLPKWWRHLASLAGRALAVHVWILETRPATDIFSAGFLALQLGDD